MRSSLAASSLVALFVVAGCGSDDEGGEERSSTYLSPQAQQELNALGVEAYRGKARITEEKQVGEATRVAFDPASGPICLWGTPYGAFYIDRGSDKTMVLLDGGGACWTGFCAASDKADEAVEPMGPALQDASNYFKDWNLVFAPYCDGSVFSGDNEVVQESDGRRRYHHGRQNLAAAFDLAAREFGDSKQVLVGGFSAGAYGTLPAMIAARLVFPQADLLIMNDSGAGIQNPAQSADTETRIAEWKYDEVIPPSCTACNGGRGQLSELFSWMLKNDSNVRISVLGYYRDQVIGVVFNKFTPEGYEHILKTETGKHNAAYPDRFKRYMLPGDLHVLSGRWLTITADGVKLSDWMAGMAQGDDAMWKDLLASGP
jgi:hypothetical protein